MLVLESYRLSSGFQGLKFVWVEYGPDEGNSEEREKFWNYLDMIGDRVGNVYMRLCVLGYLNGWIGDRVRAAITGENGN